MQERRSGPDGDKRRVGPRRHCHPPGAVGGHGAGRTRAWPRGRCPRSAPAACPGRPARPVLSARYPPSTAPRPGGPESSGRGHARRSPPASSSPVRPAPPRSPRLAAARSQPAGRTAAGGPQSSIAMIRWAGKGPLPDLPGNLAVERRPSCGRQRSAVPTARRSGTDRVRAAWPSAGLVRGKRRGLKRNDPEGGGSASSSRARQHDEADTQIVRLLSSVRERALVAPAPARRE